MKKPQVWHYHYDNSGHARTHLHFGGRVRHEHPNLQGYGQNTTTLHSNEKDEDKRRVKYFGRSTPSRVDAETAMNPKGDKLAFFLEEVERTRGKNKYQSELYEWASNEYDSPAIDRISKKWKIGKKELMKYLMSEQNPNTKKYTLIATVRSKSRPGVMYEVKRDQFGVLSCNCPVWVYKKGKIRTCKHVQAIRMLANPSKKWHSERLAILEKLEKHYPNDLILQGQRQEEFVSLYGRNPNMKLAKEMRKRYTGDVKAGHSDAAEYWRGQAAAYFTGNPKGEIDIKYGMTAPYKSVHISTRGKKSLCGLELKMIPSSDVAGLIRKNQLCIQCKIKISKMLGGSYPAIYNPQITVLCATCSKPINSIKTAKMVRGRLYHPECLKFLKKIQGVSNPLVDVDVCPKCHRRRGEKHKATMKAPSVKTMEKWFSDSKCKATDGCWVEPDGVCPHGHSSWMKVLLGI